jgi:hypothetical protein
MRGQVAGLIIATEEVEGVAMLRAELPVTGQTVLEQQVRLLADAGLGHILVLADQLTPALVAAADRLRRDGIAVDIARDPDEIAQRAAAPWLLLLADGMVTDQSAIDLALAEAGTTILTVPNAAAFGDYELIDHEARWAGLLVLDLARFRSTVGMLGDWDLQSTLLRTAVQAHAARVPVAAREPAPLLVPVVDPDAAQRAEQAIIARAVRRHGGLADRYIFAPLARLAAPAAMRAMLDPMWFRLGASALTLLAAVAFLLGWPATGLAGLLCAGPVDTLGRQLAALSGRAARDHRRWTLVRDGLSAAALLALAWHVGWTNVDWGPIAAALGTLAALAATVTHRRWIGRPARRPLWFAETDNLIWLLLPFALLGWWGVGLAAQAGLAFATLLKTQMLTGRG